MRRADDGEPGFAESVGHTPFESGLRTDDGEIDTFPLGQIDGLGRVGEVESLAPAEPGHARVAGRRQHAGDVRIAAEAPRDGVLAGAGAEDEEAHRRKILSYRAGVSPRPGA